MTRQGKVNVAPNLKMFRICGLHVHVLSPECRTKPIVHMSKVWQKLYLGVTLTKLDL
jgi:hypothetical protein